MKKDYQETKVFWDKIFENEEVKVAYIQEGIKIKEIDDALEWLCENGGTILDYGCGNGTLLFRCLYIGAESGVGCDLSETAVLKARKAAEVVGVENKVEFIAGDLDVLKKHMVQNFDGCILSNIIDNMLPADTQALVQYLKDNMAKNSRIFIKLNDLFASETMIQQGAETIGENLFREKSGLFLKNITEADIENMFGDKFEIVKKIHVELFGQTNRIFLLEKFQ